MERRRDRSFMDGTPMVERTDQRRLPGGRSSDRRVPERGVLRGPPINASPPNLGVQSVEGGT
eukprot:4171832-Pyramimonas_sp.AAC.1